MAKVIVIEVPDCANVDASVAAVASTLSEHEVYATTGGAADLILAAARGNPSRDIRSMPGPAALHPTGTPEIMRYFASSHLPEPLRTVSWLNCLLAEVMVRRLPDGHPQLAVGLNWLLLAKDAFVRAALDLQYQSAEE